MSTTQQQQQDQPSSHDDHHHHGSEEEYTEEEFRHFSTEQLCQLLANDAIPVAQRMRMLWYLRALPDKLKAIKVLSSGLSSESVLLKHELAYVMGQLKHTDAIPILNQVLSNESEDSMVRHEAGEALGAIASPDSLPVLRQFLNDPVREVRETCELAIENIEHGIKKQLEKNSSASATADTTEEATTADQDIFQSVDPAPPTNKYQQKTVAELREVYLNMDVSLFKRYKAMFALRNKSCTGPYEQQKEALMALCYGFREEEGALFLHEVAFVLGQLQRKETAEALEKVLRDKSLHAMVRHEAAEALGSICDPRSLEILKEFQDDHDAPVRDSCLVAVDMHNYWSKFVIPEKSDE